MSNWEVAQVAELHAERELKEWVTALVKLQVNDNGGADVHFEAFQMSDMCVGLFKEGWFDLEEARRGGGGVVDPKVSRMKKEVVVGGSSWGESKLELTAASALLLLSCESFSSISKMEEEEEEEEPIDFASKLSEKFEEEMRDLETSTDTATILCVSSLSVEDSAEGRSMKLIGDVYAQSRDSWRFR